MEYKIEIKPKALKNLDKIPHKDREKILRVLHDLKSDPFSHKRLHGKQKDQYSARVWPYRIIYRIEKKILVVIIIDIGHRQGIY